MTALDSEVLWEPGAPRRAQSRIGHYVGWLDKERGRPFPGYPDLWHWSVTDLEGFWSSIWDYFDVMAGQSYDSVLTDRHLPVPRWFTGSTLNLAEHVMRGAAEAAATNDGIVIKARSQTRAPIDLTALELESLIARARAGLRRLGIGPGDRVAAYLPNIPEAVVLYLACVSLGAVWSSCSPEFGVDAVLVRFEQVSPKVLFAVDGYRFGTTDVPRDGEVARIRRQLPTLEEVVTVPYLHADGAPAIGCLPWDEFMADVGAPPAYDRLPFDQPLHIAFSSGTTGLPKPIVHGQGGVLLDHLKTHAFHLDLGPGDRIFFFCTTGWIAWNWLISTLAVGSSIVLFDGNPMYPDASLPWQLAAATGATSFGSSPGLMLAARREGIVPRKVADLSRLRSVVAGGAPLAADGFRWIYEAVGNDVYLQSVSGGTEVVGAFLGGVPLLPCRAGLITTRWLGCRVEAFDADGRPVVGEQGELVVREPLPSMPLGLWGDLDGSRLRTAYYDRYPGVYCHGDWITFTPDGASVISGRSDATLNRGGVRLGTSEFYTVVEALPEVADSLVVHMEDLDGGAGSLILFLALADGQLLDDELRNRIKVELRRRLSPRHIPDLIEAVPEIPQTLTGKKLEIPVKRILTGTPVDQAVSRGSLANPAALAPFEAMALYRTIPGARGGQGSR